MSHPLLLRLFQSEHFGPRLAVSYLYRYPDHVGISYYLCDRLREASPREIEFYLPQLCHLLISTPTESGALEAFLLERCDHSTHTAMLMLWLLQAHLSDLRLQHATPQFAICRRVFNRVQSIVFGVDAEVSLKYSRQDHGDRSPDPKQRRSNSGTPQSQSGHAGFGTIYAALRPPAFVANKVNPNIAPAFVGMSVIMAGVALPQMARSAGEVALAQGRRRPRHAANTGIGSEGPVRRKFGGHATGLGISSLEGESSTASSANQDPPHEPLANGYKESAGDKWRSYGGIGLQQPTESRSSNEGHQGKGSRALRAETMGQIRRYPHSTVSLTTSPTVNGRSGKSDHQDEIDGLGRRLNTQSMTTLRSEKDRIVTGPIALSSRRASTLDLEDHTVRRLPHDPFSVDDPEDSASLENEDDVEDEDDDRETVRPSRFDFTQSQDALHRLLKGNYLRSETQFILHLQDIATRLIIVPKAARLSALRAELTMLNNNLPAEVCIPLWCPADRDNSATRNQSVSGTGRKGNDETTLDASDPAQLPPPPADHVAPKAVHHRVVRISPSDAVVLNSADRAPYLLCVEVLSGDLSFDPSRRQNKQKIEGLIQEQLIKAKRSSDGFVSSPSLDDVQQNTMRTPESTQSRSPAQRESAMGSSPSQDRRIDRFAVSNGRPAERSNGPSPLGANRTGIPEIVLEESVDRLDRASSTPPLQSCHEDEPDEMDLVEQYSRGLILDGSAIQTSASSNGLSPIEPPDSSFGSPSERQNALSSSNRVKHNRSHSIGEDDYAERMRTAAIMLAQLNANSTKLASLAPTATGRHTGVDSSTSAVAAGSGVAAGHGPDASQRAAAIAMRASSSTITGGSAQATAALARAEQNRRAKTLAGPEAEDIRRKIIGEMVALEERRMRLGQVGRQSNEMMGSGGKVEEELRSVRVKDDPSGEIFRESWERKRERIRAASPYGHLTNWDLFSVIVKTGADLRQEQLACQIIEESKRIFEEANVDIWLRPFRILVTSDSSGLVETITDSISIHSIKKDAYAREINERGYAFSLLDHFVKQFGPITGSGFKKAQDGFMRSLAGYSLVCYILQIKDRHNGNILLDHDGRVVHIDFGFMLSNTPGSVGFEMAPFKLPQEYIDVLGGTSSPKWEEFRQLMHQGFKTLRRESERIVMLVECLMKDSKMPCFMLGPGPTLQALRERFQPSLSESATNTFVDRLILSAAGSYFTRLYDQFQYYSQGVL